jgi:hypothetical protein
MHFLALREASVANMTAPVAVLMNARLFMTVLIQFKVYDRRSMQAVLSLEQLHGAEQARGDKRGILRVMAA